MPEEVSRIAERVTTKVCTKCKKEKPLEEFHNSSAGHLGKKSKCKACEKKASHDYWLRKKAKKQSPEDQIGSGVAVLKTLMQKTGALRNPAPISVSVDLAKTKADEHWDYIRLLLAAHLDEVADMSCIEFHYKTAFVHGYKHGQADFGRSPEISRGDGELR